ncbi:hypothetical protein NEOLEDRAFT_1180309 [Neolentinus lepideus HHB14362 ss-1]|uniref:Uncharacterized protein n=1 Tax=Neolentinus lepideus HHB14362 ss-1 TaxID=1314782 RepID=A0A165QYS5_9AGAM|nr:hypothetical protein NEOLEDRAFT_1180309 [Neolentinus lepideus HHB14362 ss-1]
MPSPSSSATTPSPPLPYLQPSPAPSASTTDAPDTQERDTAINKFIARAQISKARIFDLSIYRTTRLARVVVDLTFDLRARLAYASYKANHQVPHLPLHDLEVKTQAASISRSVPAKRKVNAGSSQHATQASSLSSRQGQMAPPPPVSRISSSGSSGSAKTGQSLFAALLGPPASKNARTIRNPSAPPAPVPSRTQQTRKPTQNASPRSRTKNHPDVKRSRHHHRGKSRERQHTQKGKQKERGRATPDSTASVIDDPDLAAAQTLSSFLLPRNSFSTASPRSSFSAASDHSHSHFAQSSARTVDAISSSAASAGRPLTPPLSQESAAPVDTPKRSAPTDKEAAEYMLILATSPSPARPRTQANRDALDRAAFGVLGGGGSRTLFPGSQSSGDLSPSPAGRRGKPLARERSFSSTMPVITPAETQSSDGSSQMDAAGAPSGTVFTPASLLPPPASPLPSRPSSSLSIFPSQGQMAPLTPGNFNMREFVNMSPSPGTPRKPIQTKTVPSSPRPGKKLFEQETRDSGGHSAPVGGALAAGFVPS